MQIFGLSMIHVPYKNSPQSIADVAAGYVQLAFAEAGASQPLIAARRLRALAVSSLTRFNSLPDVRERIASLDLIPIEPPSVEEAQRYIASETKKWGNLIRSLGLEGSQ